jgi:UDP-4-amino-4,6-dideoxy-N-acetyl-beta-L-altrosamine transaminase
MKIIPYGRQDIDKDDIDAVLKTLTSNFLTQGPKVKEFENSFATYVGAEYAVSVNNATSGLHLAILALGLKKGERVITTPITFAASANCVRYVGGEVWFADIDPDTYLLSLESTRKLIESKPKGFFKGIIPVDFAGLPVDLEAYKSLADEYGMWVIEDSCHAPGGYFTDSQGVKQMCGNGNFSNISIFSFHPVKHIACGEGGMVTTNDKEVYKQLLRLRSHGITKGDDQYINSASFANSNTNTDEYPGWYMEMQQLGYNYRLTDIQCSLGITQLKKNKKGVIRRNQIANNYKEAFEGKIKFQSLPDGVYNAHHLFVIEVDDRKGLYDFLKTQNIFAQIHYIPLHMFPYYKKIGYTEANLINSENYYSNCISLPMFPSLTNDEQKFVIKNVLSYIN